MKDTRVYLCEDTTVGIFTAVYDAGRSRYGHDNIRLQVRVDGQAENMELFSEYVEVAPDEEKAEKVLRSVREKISGKVYRQILRVSGSCAADKADVIYHYIVYGFAMGDRVRDALQIPCVRRLFEINRHVANEARYWREFLRFQELPWEQPVLFAVFEPDNYVLPMVTEHFADRLNPEWFIIYDKHYAEAAFHSPGREWYLRRLEPAECERMDELEKTEEAYAGLWKIFFESVSIQERTNPALQRNNLPLHYRKHMPEFRDGSGA